MSEPTERQLEILVAYVECGGSKAAAIRLSVSERYIRSALSALHAIIGGTNSAQTFALAVQRGLIDPHELHISEAA
jgi:DNA-binding CsgD family transcriptional regulator